MSQYIVSLNKSILLYSVQLTIDNTFSIVIIRYKELILVLLHYNEFHYIYIYSICNLQCIYITYTVYRVFECIENYMELHVIPVQCN